MLTNRKLILLCVLALIIAACATSNFGKALQAADAQKRIVEAATVEVMKLHITGKISDADYTRARAAYDRWAKAQVAMALSLSKWRSLSIRVAEAKVKADAVKSAANEQARAQAEKNLAAAEAQLAIDISNVRPLVDAYLAIVTVWIDKN